MSSALGSGSDGRIIITASGGALSRVQGADPRAGTHRDAIAGDVEQCAAQSPGRRRGSVRAFGRVCRKKGGAAVRGVFGSHASASENRGGSAAVKDWLSRSEMIQ